MSIFPKQIAEVTHGLTEARPHLTHAQLAARRAPRSEKVEGFEDDNISVQLSDVNIMLHKQVQGSEYKEFKGKPQIHNTPFTQLTPFQSVSSIQSFPHYYHYSFILTLFCDPGYAVFYRDSLDENGQRM